MNLKVLGLLVVGLCLYLLAQAGIANERFAFAVNSVNALASMGTLVQWLFTDKGPNAKMLNSWSTRSAVIFLAILGLLSLHQLSMIVAAYFWPVSNSPGQFSDWLAGIALTFGFLLGVVVGAYAMRRLGWKYIVKEEA